MLKVAVIVYEGVSLFEVSCALELFALDRPEYSDWYQCRVVSIDGRNVNTNVGVSISSDPLESLSLFDLIVIPAWFTDGRSVPERLRTELLECHQQNKRIVSFCSGAFLLGSVGLLKGRKATTHWRYAQRFQTLFPDATYVKQVLYVYDGQIGSSAGSSAAIDLGLEIIRSDHGHAVASEVAKRLVLAVQRKGGQAQYAENTPIRPTQKLGDVLDWAISKLNQGVCVSQMAEKANMSRRSFNRYFKSTQGITPSEWLIEQKLDLARRLLETSDVGIDQVAYESGFPSSMTLRHHFRKTYQSTPMHYRQQFLKTQTSSA